MNNFVKRTLFGFIYVAVIVVSAIVLPPLLPWLATIAGGVMLHEFYSVSIGKDELIAQRICALLIFLLFSLGLWGLKYGILDRSFLAAPLLAALALPFIQIFSKSRFNTTGFAFVFYGLGWIALPVALLPFICFKDGAYSGYLLLSFFIIIWCSDVGAYCVGSVLGQRPGAKRLAPSISPKKSWWGVAGGLVLSVAAAAILEKIGFFSFGWVHSAALGIVLSIGSVIGDLFESLWKRSFGIKDSGKAIPGHGGFLDRLDSSLVAMPLASVYLLIFNLI